MKKSDLIKKVIEEVKDEKLRNEILSEIIKKEKKDKITAKDVGYLLEDFGFNMKEIGEFNKFQYIFGFIAITFFCIIGFYFIFNSIFLDSSSFDRTFDFVFGFTFIVFSLIGYYKLWLVRKVPDRLKKIGR